jgi:hypothetical protein
MFEWTVDFCTEDSSSRSYAYLESKMEELRRMGVGGWGGGLVARGWF